MFAYICILHHFIVLSLLLSRYVLFLSGLDLKNESSMLSLQLLVDYVCGHLGQRSEQERCSNIVRIVIGGMYIPNDV